MGNGSLTCQPPARPTRRWSTTCWPAWPATPATSSNLPALPALELTLDAHQRLAQAAS